MLIVFFDFITRDTANGVVETGTHSSMAAVHRLHSST